MCKKRVLLGEWGVEIGLGWQETLTTQRTARSTVLVHEPLWLPYLQVQSCAHTLSSAASGQVAPAASAMLTPVLVPTLLPVQGAAPCCQPCGRS